VIVTMIAGVLATLALFALGGWVWSSRRSAQLLTEAARDCIDACTARHVAETGRQDADDKLNDLRRALAARARQWDSALARLERRVSVLHRWEQSRVAEALRHGELPIDVIGAPGTPLLVDKTGTLRAPTSRVAAALETTMGELAAFRLALDVEGGE
jgi:hypothetical protein